MKCTFPLWFCIIFICMTCLLPLILVVGCYILENVASFLWFELQVFSVCYLLDFMMGFFSCKLENVGSRTVAQRAVLERQACAALASLHWCVYPAPVPHRLTDSSRFMLLLYILIYLHVAFQFLPPTPGYWMFISMIVFKFILFLFYTHLRFQRFEWKWPL